MLYIYVCCGVFIRVALYMSIISFRLCKYVYVLMFKVTACLGWALHFILFLFSSSIFVMWCTFTHVNNFQFHFQSYCIHCSRICVYCSVVIMYERINSNQSYSLFVIYWLLINIIFYYS